MFGAAIQAVEEFDIYVHLHFSVMRALFLSLVESGEIIELCQMLFKKWKMDHMFN